jgi:hypothetical protein
MKFCWITEATCAMMPPNLVLRGGFRTGGSAVAPPQFLSVHTIVSEEERSPAYVREGHRI